MAEYDIQGALQEGYDPMEIARYLQAQGMLTPENHFRLLRASQGPQGVVTGGAPQPITSMPAGGIQDPGSGLPQMSPASGHPWLEPVTRAASGISDALNVNTGPYTGGPLQDPQDLMDSVGPNALPKSWGDVGALAGGAALSALPYGKLGKAALGASEGDITAAQVLRAAKAGPGAFGGFTDYIRRNPTAGEDLLDFSKVSPMDPTIAGLGQLPRYDPDAPGRKGASARIVDAFQNPRVLDALREHIQAGATDLPDDWYNTSPIFDKFLEVLKNPKIAVNQFRKWMQHVASTSSGAAVPDNIRTAGYFNYLAEQGLPIPKKPAKGYGSELQKSHIAAENTLRAIGGIDPMANPKRGSFVENLVGNEDLLTADRHFWRALGIFSEDPRFLKTTLELEGKNPAGEKIKTKIHPRQMFHDGELLMQDAVKNANLWDDAPNKNEYLHAEQKFRELANSLGYTTADAQGKLWLGAGKKTGLGSPAETFARIFAQRVQYTADRLNVDPKVILEKAIRGQIPLLGLGGAAVGLGSLAAPGEPQAEPAPQ